MYLQEHLNIKVFAVMISLVVIIMILHRAIEVFGTNDISSGDYDDTTQCYNSWNYTLPVISPIDSNVIFKCPFNQPFINVTSTYNLL